MNRRYTIQFSNNEEIDFEIRDKNLAHILGINYYRINIKCDIFSKLDNNNYEDYIVETLIAIENPKRLFVGQEIIIPTQILTDDMELWIKI